MAPLTWREVSAPNFSGVSESQRLVANLLQSGFGGLQDAVSGFKKSRQDAASSTYLDQISRFTDPAALAAAQQSGAIDATGVSSDAIQIGMKRNAELLNNQNQGLVNDHTQFTNNAYARDDAQAQARLAAQPEVAKLLASVQNLAGSGDPAKVEQARQLLTDNTGLLTSVGGYKADAIPGLLDAARGTGTAGFGYKKTVYDELKDREARGVNDDAQAAAFKQINGGITPEMAIRNIQNDNSIKDPRTKVQAIDIITKSAGAFPTPDQGSILLQTLTGQTSVPQAVPPQTSAPQAAPAPQGGGIQNPLSQLVDAKEGGGNYSTLYAHAQKGGGAFAGVDVSKQTIGDLKQFASSDGAYGQHQKNQLGYLATPMGRYQIVGQTLGNTAKEMGLPDNTVFTPQVQDAMFQHIADKALSGPRSMAGKMAALRGQWDGFRNVSDSALSAAITAYQNGDRGQLGNITNGQSSGNTPQPLNAGAFPRGGQATMDQMLNPDRLGGAPNGPVTIANGGAPINAGAFPPGNSLAELSRPQITLPVGSTTNTDVAPQAPAPSPVEQIAAAAAANGSAGATAPTGLERLASWFPGLGGRSAAPGQDAASQLTQAAAPTPAPAAASAAPADNGNTDTAAQSAQKLLDQGTIDQASNADAPLFAQISQAQSSTDSINQVMKKLIAPGGALEGMNEQVVLDALNKAKDASGGKLKPAAAGAIISQNVQSKDLVAAIDKVPIIGSLIPDSWFSGDRFGGPENGGTSARRINMEGVQRDLNKIGYNVDGSIKLSRGAAGIAAQRAANYSAEQVKAIQGQVLSNSIQISQIQQAIAKGNNDPQLLQDLANLQAQQQTFSAILNQIGAEPGSPTSQFSGQGEQPRPQ